MMQRLSGFPKDETTGDYSMRLSLQPLDVPVALALLEHPESTYPDLARRLHISLSTAHSAVKRLEWAGLVARFQGRLRVDRAGLEEFLVHGVRYAFPAQRERPKRGVPTAYAAPVLEQEIDASVEPVVWPSPRGSVIGAAITPLIPSAPVIASEWRELYDMLALVDALRIGTARDREAAEEQLKERLRHTVE
jgi:DNA-binding Lrp family transcriptional regulator